MAADQWAIHGSKYEKIQGKIKLKSPFFMDSLFFSILEGFM